jgi:ABC-type transporter Mla subunit MlaD
MIDDHVGALRGNSRVTYDDVTGGNVGVLEITAELERAASATLRIIAE